MCKFSKLQIRQLSQLHEQFKQNNTEFEVLKTDCQLNHALPEHERPKDKPRCHEPFPTSSCGDGVRAQEISTSRRSPSGTAGVVPPVPQADLCALQGQRDGLSTSSTTATGGPGHQGLHFTRENDNGKFQDTTEGIFERDAGRLRGDLNDERTHWPGSELRGIKPSQCSDRAGLGDRPGLTTGGTATEVRSSGDDQALRVSQAGSQLQETVLEVPEATREPMLHFCVARDPAVPGSDLPERPGAGGLRPNDLQPGVQDPRGEHHPGATATVPTHQDRQEGHQPVQDRGEVCDVWQTSQVRGHGTGKAERDRTTPEGSGANIPGLSGVEEVGGVPSSGSMERPGDGNLEQLEEEVDSDEDQGDQQRDKGVNHVLRRAQTALGETAGMWQNLITYVQSDSPRSDQNMAKMAQGIFDDQNPRRISDRRQLKRLASLLGVTKKKARLVAEVFNPERFGPRTQKHGLDQGMAFDLTLGQNLLDSRQRQLVREYVGGMKPGLVVLSTPCTMLSQLQNLNMKHLTDETKHREFVKRLIQAKVLLNFSCEICELVQSYGGTFLLEQPHTSKAWKEPKVQRLAAQPGVQFTVNDQCMFGLRSAEGYLHKKPTGWLCNNAMVSKALDRQCDHTHEHMPVFGSGPGGSRSKRAQEYPKQLVDTILGAYARSLQHPLQEKIKVVRDVDLIEETYHTENVFHVENDQPLQNDQAVKNVKVSTNNGDLKNLDASDVMAVNEDAGAEAEIEDQGGEVAGPWLPRERPLSVEQLVRRAHCGLGHVANDRLARILHQAGARKEAVEYAKKLQCDVCQRHKHTAPARAAAPPRDLAPNQIVGVDTIYLPGLQFNGKRKMALNIVDWATRFQLVIPLQDHTPRSARRAFLQWTRIFGTPERIYDDLGKEFRGCFEMMADQDAAILDPGSLESPTQRSLTERAGRTYKEIFSKTLMEVTCNSWDEWQETVDVVTATVNRLANKSGFSPVQRMLGYSPRIPGSLMSGGFNDLSTASRYAAGDLQVQRAMDLRTAAAIAYHKADSEQALRNALHAGPRVWQHYEIGQTVYYWKKGMERGKKDHPYFWHGPAKVILTNLPTTVWIAHRGRIVKACPEHLRPIAEEEKFILTDWIQDILDTKKKLQENEYKGYIVLDEKPPDALDFQPPLPPQVPRHRLMGKHKEEDIEFQPDIYLEKRRRIDEGENQPSPGSPPRSVSMAPTTPARTEDLEQEPREELPEIQEEQPGQLKNDQLPNDLRTEQGLDEDGEHERGQVRHGGPPEEGEERPTKRQRAELLEAMFTQLEQTALARKRKETNYKNMEKSNQMKFDKAILKEIKNNMQSGAYQALKRGVREN